MTGLRGAALSVLERTLGRPLLVRDRVLAATSADGLRWQKSTRVHLTHPAHRYSHMTYFTAHDPDGELWLRASVWDPATESWYTELGRSGDWVDVRPLGVDHLYAPAWDGSRLYGVAVAGGRSEPACFATDSAHRPVERVAQEWEGIGDFAVVQDIALVRSAPHRLVAFCSVGLRDDDVAIHRWESSDGARWGHAGEAVATPLPGPYRLANNPAVVAIPGGGWRMYFRTGERPALGNAIRSARSVDLETWTHEEGERIAPGGLWDAHGAGFPHVWIDGGTWHMRYAGYWGRTRAAAPVAERWAKVGAG